jgi:hypothetical protein
MERHILNILSGSRQSHQDWTLGTRVMDNDLEEIRSANRDKRNAKMKEVLQSIAIERHKKMAKENARDGDAQIINEIFPPPPPEPEPVLTKYLIRDYILFDRVDDLGHKYRYGVFAVYSSFVKLDADGNYLDPNVASNVDNETRVITAKTVITPRTFGSNSIGKPIYVEEYPVIEFQTTSEDPTDFIDQIYRYEFGGDRFLELKKVARKKVERDQLEDVIDPMDTPFSIESAISQNQQFYNRHIEDLYLVIVNGTYVSSTPYDILMQTVIVMLGI